MSYRHGALFNLSMRMGIYLTYAGRLFWSDRTSATVDRIYAKYITGGSVPDVGDTFTHASLEIDSSVEELARMCVPVDSILVGAGGTFAMDPSANFEYIKLAVVADLTIPEGNTLDTVDTAWTCLSLIQIDWPTDDHANRVSKEILSFEGSGYGDTLIPGGTPLGLVGETVGASSGIGVSNVTLTFRAI